MLSHLRRWFTSSPRAAAGSDIEPWAAERGFQFRRVRDDAGFVIEGRSGKIGWRGEWGVATRSYVSGLELRLIGELGTERDIQVLVLNRALADALEKTVFDQFVEGVQTRIDTEVPPEARWLVMFPKLSGPELKTLRERWVALASVKPWLQRWLAGPLTPMLEVVTGEVSDATPVVLTIARGRLTLRTAMPEARPEQLATWLARFELALTEAQRVMAELPDVTAPRTANLPTGWGGTTSPGDLGPR